MHSMQRAFLKVSVLASLALAALALVPAAHAQVIVGDWTFQNGNANDVTGHFGATVLHGASVVNNQLVVSASNSSYAITGTYAGPTLTTKTLVSWLYLDDLNARSGSALTLEKGTGGGQVFDSIDYAEAEANRWMNGSDYGQRSQSSPQQSAAETASPSQLIEMAIVYNADNSIKIYRNGALYSAYTQGSLQTYPGGMDTNVVFGLRHSEAGGNRFLTGRIQEARIYNGALTAAQINGLTLSVPEPGSAALLMGLTTVGVSLLRKRRAHK